MRAKSQSVHNFWRERKTEADGTEVLLLTSLTLYRWAKPAHVSLCATISPFLTYPLDVLSNISLLWTDINTDWPIHYRHRHKRWLIDIPINVLSNITLLWTNIDWPNHQAMFCLISPCCEQTLTDLTIRQCFVSYHLAVKRHKHWLTYLLDNVLSNITLLWRDINVD